MTQDAVLLLAYGGPEKVAEIEPFLKKLLRRDPLPPGLLERVIKKYEAVGGGSPLPGICRQIREALAEKLTDLPVYLGFRYSEPEIAQTVSEIRAAGIKRVYAVSLSPHSSQISTKAYYDALGAAADGLEVIALENWYREGTYNQLLANRIKAAAKGFDPGSEDCRLVFSAHNIPVSYLEQGDSYVDEIKANLSEIMRRLPFWPYSLAYQSKGQAPGDWLEPELEQELIRFSEAGIRRLLVVPLSFSMDHLETLYDLDIELQAQARELGLEVRRSRPANADDDFIEMLARFIKRRRK